LLIEAGGIQWGRAEKDESGLTEILSIFSFLEGEYHQNQYKKSIRES
jgi:hypothetical protein